jgi:Na+/melibiose symporter-like transporter
VSSRTGGPLSAPALLAFAAPSIAITALQLALTVHLPRYFASHMGMSLVAVGSAFALVRAIDIPLDPLLGLMMDRTRSRLGRYRPWALGGAPVLMAALVILIHPPAPLGEPGLVAVLFLLFLGYSALYLSQLAWAGALAADYQQRSRIFAAITGLGVTGAVAVLLIPVVMNRLGRSDADGVEAMLWFVIAATPACAILMALRTPERIAPDHAPRHALADYAALLGRPNVLRLLAADLCIQLGPGWMAALYLYDFTLVRGFTTAQANLLLLIYIAAGFAGAPAVSALAAAINKHRALMACTSLFSLCLIATPLIPKAGFLPAALLMFAAGAAFAGFTVMLRALAADIADEVRLERGRESMGLIFALTNATTKLAVACALFLTFHVLAYVGFDAREGAENTARALLGLELAFLAGPIVFVLAGGLCFLGYRLDSVRHSEIRRQLDARDLIRAGDPPPQGEVAEGPRGVQLRTSELEPRQSLRDSSS